MEDFIESEESTSEQIKIGKEQGDSIQKALDEMMKIAEDGSEIESGDYLIAYIIENSEALYTFEDEELNWEEPKEENKHIEICIRDKFTKRFIPYLDVQIKLTNKETEKIIEKDLPFIWHPWLYHYGANIEIEPGDYTLEIYAEAPEFSRHDEENGKIMTEPIEAEFDIEIS